MIRLFNSVSLSTSSWILPLIIESANSYALITSFSLASISFLLFNIVSFKLDIAVSKLVWTLSIASCNELSAFLYAFSNEVIRLFNSVSLSTSSWILPLIIESASSYALITSFSLASISFLLFNIVSFKLDIAVSKFDCTVLIATCKDLSASL